jgi:DNA ligase (NAD+)
MDKNITDSERILNLRKELTHYSFWYYTHHTSLVADEQYDHMLKELVNLEKDHPEMADPNSPTMRVGSNVPTGFLLVEHAVKMLSLDNVTSVDETAKFFSSVSTQEVTIEMKLDGLSLHLDYVDGNLVRAVTRGNGSEGADVTENARTIKTLPLVLLEPVTVSIRGEVCWSLSAFNAHNASLPPEDAVANPRNGASGSMSLKDSKEVAKRNLSFIAYSVPTGLPPRIGCQEALLEWLGSLGFVTTMSLPVTKDMAGLPYLTSSLVKDELDAAIRYLDDYRKHVDFGTDGLVVKLSSLADQRDLGEGTKSPKWAAAYKFPPEIKETRMIGVVIQVGKTGQMSPVALLDPVSLGGAIVQRVSLCNQDEFDRLSVDIGDTVYVQRSAEVIPKVMGLARPAPGKVDVNRGYQMPKTCPSCGSLLVREKGMVHLYCPNTESCKDQIYGKLFYALGKSALDIDGCGEVTVSTLMSKGNVKSLTDLYELEDFSFLSPTQAKKLKLGLEKAKTSPLWRKLCALNIEGIGKTKSQELTAKFNSLKGMVEGRTNIDEAISPDSTVEAKKVSANQDIVVDILGPVGVLSLADAYDSGEVQTAITRLAAHGFLFQEEARVQGPLSGKSFCITGSLLSGSRDEVGALITKYGGSVKSSVTKKCDYLIMGSEGGLNKQTAAAKFGTVILDESTLYTMIGIPMPVLEAD